MRAYLINATWIAAALALGGGLFLFVIYPGNEATEPAESLAMLAWLAQGLVRWSWRLAVLAVLLEIRRDNGRGDARLGSVERA